MSEKPQSDYPRSARYIKLKLLLERCEARLLLQDATRRDLASMAQRAGSATAVLLSVGVALMAVAITVASAAGEQLNVVAQVSFGGLMLSCAVTGALSFAVVESRDWSAGPDLSEVIHTLGDNTPEEVLAGLVIASYDGIGRNDEVLTDKKGLFQYLIRVAYAPLFFLLVFAGSLYGQFLL